MDFTVPSRRKTACERALNRSFTLNCYPESLYRGIRGKGVLNDLECFALRRRRDKIAAFSTNVRRGQKSTRELDWSCRRNFGFSRNSVNSSRFLIGIFYCSLGETSKKKKKNKKTGTKNFEKIDRRKRSWNQVKSRRLIRAAALR